MRAHLMTSLNHALEKKSKIKEKVSLNLSEKNFNLRDKNRIIIIVIPCKGDD